MNRHNPKYKFAMALMRARNLLIISEVMFILRSQETALSSILRNVSKESDLLYGNAVVVVNMA